MTTMEQLIADSQKIVDGAWQSQDVKVVDKIDALFKQLIDEVKKHEFPETAVTENIASFRERAIYHLDTGIEIVQKYKYVKAEEKELIFGQLLSDANFGLSMIKKDYLYSQYGIQVLE